MIRSPFPPALLLALAIGGCAGDERRYPSLARRPGEAQGFAEPAVTPVAVVADPALDAQVATLRGRLATIAKGFDDGAGRAESAAGVRGARTVGSEAWLGAQSALAELDDWRAQATSLASEADALTIARAGAGQPDYPALNAVRDAARDEAERQDAGIARLQALTPVS